MKLGIDLDGCGCDFISDSRKAVSYHRGIDPELLPEPTTWHYPVKDWGMTYEAFWESIHWGVKHGMVWNDTPPVDGFREALNELRHRGHSVHICTSRHGFEHVTHDWLDKWFIPYDTVTISEDKTIVNVDLFIDDCPSHIEALNKTEAIPVVFDQPYNRPPVVEDVLRVYSWEQFVNEVETITEFKEQLGLT